MNELKVFNHEEFGAIRTTMINEEPWFVGKDVSNILGYQNPSMVLDLCHDFEAIAETMDIVLQNIEKNSFCSDDASQISLKYMCGNIKECVFRLCELTQEKFRGGRDNFGNDERSQPE